ncbi:hypothetical protein N9H37_02155 [Congregibacter sp.]|nr:hypothetical protein [Congregibacter sp.]MDA8962136.1 hypothetical protein [Congregibacter sp.]
MGSISQNEGTKFWLSLLIEKTYGTLLTPRSLPFAVRDGDYQNYACVARQSAVP